MITNKKLHQLKDAGLFPRHVSLIDSNYAQREYITKRVYVSYFNIAY